jgi:hypothetical protein
LSSAPGDSRCWGEALNRDAIPDEALTEFTLLEAKWQKNKPAFRVIQNNELRY